MSGSNKRRVLHFLSHGNIGGQERAQYQLLRAFADDDEITFAVAIGKSEGLYVDLVKGLNIPVIDLHIHSGYDPRFDCERLNALRHFHAHHLHDPSPNQMLLSILAGGKIKRIFTRRGGIIDYNRYGLKRKVKFLASKFLLTTFFDGFSGNSQNAAEFVRSYYNISHRIYVLYNGIDFKLLQPKKTAHFLQKKFSVDQNDFKVGTACQLVRLKRVDLLIRAFGLCNIKNSKLIIFGKGPEKNNLQRLALSLGLKKNIIFAGEVPDMADFYQVLDCFVLASGKEESFGNAVVEAMFLKVPSIIMSDSAGLREHIIDNVTGFTATDQCDLAGKIEFVHFNPEASQKVAENASAYVFNKYSIENMKRAYKQFYRKVIR